MVADERISKLHAAALFCGLCFSFPLTFALLGWEDRDWAAFVFGAALLFVAGYCAIGDAPSNVLGRGSTVLERFVLPCFALVWCGLLVLPIVFACEALSPIGPSDRATQAYEGTVAVSAIALEYWALRSARWRMTSSIAIIAGLLSYWLCAVPAVVGPLTEFVRHFAGDGVFLGWAVWSDPSLWRTPVYLYFPALVLIVSRLHPGMNRWSKALFLAVVIGVPLACAAYGGYMVKAANALMPVRRPANPVAFPFVLPWQGTLVLPLLLASCAASARFAWSLTPPIPAALRAVAIVALLAVEGSARLMLAPIIAFTAAFTSARLVSTDTPLTRVRQAIVLAGWIAGSLAMAVILHSARRSPSHSTWPVLAIWLLTFLCTAGARWRSS